MQCCDVWLACVQSGKVCIMCEYHCADQLLVLLQFHKLTYLAVPTPCHVAGLFHNPQALAMYAGLPMIFAVAPL